MAGGDFDFDPPGAEHRSRPRPRDDEVSLRIRLLQSRMVEQGARITHATNQRPVWRWPMSFSDPEQRPPEQQFSFNRRLRESSVAEDDPTHFFSREQLALGDHGPYELFPNPRASGTAALGMDPAHLTRERLSRTEQYGLGEESGLGTGARALPLEEALATAGRDRIGTLLEEAGLRDVEPPLLLEEQQARLERSALRPAMHPWLFAPQNVTEQDIDAAMQRLDSAWEELENDEPSAGGSSIRRADAEVTICPRCFGTLEVYRFAWARPTLICPRYGRQNGWSSHEN